MQPRVSSCVIHTMRVCALPSWTINWADICMSMSVLALSTGSRCTDELRRRAELWAGCWRELRRRPSSLADRRPHKEVVMVLKQEMERTLFLPQYNSEEIVEFIESQASVCVDCSESTNWGFCLLHLVVRYISGTFFASAASKVSSKTDVFIYLSHFSLKENLGCSDVVLVLVKHVATLKKL